MICTIRALTLCLVLFSALAAQAQSGKEMLHACQALQRQMHRQGSSLYLPAGAEINQCWGFMEAVQEYSVLMDQNGKMLLDACLSSVSTTADIVKVFVRYARAHPQKLHQTAAAIAYDAVADAFPCSGKKSK